MNILVTGATGYIGAHVVKTLCERGHTVQATDYNDEQNNIEKYCSRWFKWDIREKRPSAWPYSCIADIQIDKIIHIAAVTKVNSSVKDPWRYYDTNINGTYNVIKEWSKLKAFKFKHFIYCSTGSAFQPESNPYAMSKFAGEKVTEQMCDNYSLVRFYNVSGNDGMYKFDDEMSHLIRKAARVANRSNGHPIMPLYGTDFDTRDGTCVRNYTHIKDIVDGVVRIAEAEPTNQIECLGSPEGVTVKEVIDTMKKVSNIDFPVEIEPRRDGDIAISTVPISSKFFKQSKTLEDMCSDALEYER